MKEVLFTVASVIALSLFIWFIFTALGLLR
jgi:hypothetical protein